MDDDVNVFSSTVKTPKKEEDAKTIYAKLLTQIIKQDTTGLMRMPMENEDDVIIDGKRLVLRVKNKANLNYLNQKNTLDFINNVLMNLSYDLRFVCTGDETQKNYSNDVDIMGRLNTLFPKELIVKTKK